MSIQDFISKLSELANAFAIIKNDKELTIYHANQLFYDLLDMSEADIRLKSGNRLSAMVPVEKFLLVQDFFAQPTQDLVIELAFRGYDGQTIPVCCFLHKLNNGVDGACMILYDLQEYKENKKNLDMLSKLFQLVLTSENISVVVYDDNNHILHSSGFYTIKHESLVTFPDSLLEHDVIHADDVATVLENNIGIKTLSKRENCTCEVRIRNTYDEYIWMKLTFHRYEINDSMITICLFSDINSLKKGTFEYIEQSLFYQSIMSAQDAFGHMDITDNRGLKVGGLWNAYNPVLDEMNYETLFVTFINKVVHPDDRAHYIEVVQRDNLIRSFDNGIKQLSCEFRRIVNQNKMTWMLLTIHLFQNPKNHHLMALMYIKNIDEQKKAKFNSINELEYDALTKLYTYRSIEQQANIYMNHMDKNECCAFILCDVNDLKDINAKYGFAAGDQVLVDLSNILSIVFRRNDILGRYGGDEFIVLLKDVATSDLDKRIKSMFEFIDEKQRIPFHVSVGIVYVHQGDTFVNALKQAMLCLNQIKDHRFNQFVMYQDDITSNLVVEKELNKQLSGKLIDASSWNTRTNDFDHMLSSQADIAYLVNPTTYELLLGNQSFYERLGITQEDCEGRACYEILHHRTSPCPYCQKCNWTTDKFYMYRNYNSVLEQEFLIKNKLVSWKGEMTLLAFAIDLSNDKAIVDLVDSDASEDRLILTGIQNMQKENTLDRVMEVALEVIGLFFRSDAVRFWFTNMKKNDMECRWMYRSESCNANLTTYLDHEKEILSNWLKEHKWQDRIMFENSEAIMFESYELFEVMQSKQVRNQQWISFSKDDREFGVIEIDNVHANFRNSTFINTFLTFVANEWNRCSMVENIMYNLQFDALTGLRNRHSYDDFLCGYDPDSYKNAGVIVIDINSLSNINSSKGAQVGDEYLRYLATLINRNFTKAFNYRLGADEFQSVWLNTSTKELEIAIASLRKQINDRNEFSISIGYAYDSVEKKISSLVEFATNNMRVDKKNQINQMSNIKKIDYYKQQNELIDHIEKGDYLIYLQPKVNTKNNAVIGAEALIRYLDDKRGIVPPSEYIPQLEKSGLIRYIDLFVFEEVCKLIAKWKKQQKNCPVISLNFSRLTMMEQNLIEMMDTIVKKYDIDKKYLEIEITESYADVGKTLLYLSANRIHQAHYAVSLDDFGTNFTNLSILSDIHVDVLKIDKSLIHSMTVQKKNVTVLKHIIDMCDELNIKVIAEGVENMEQRNLLLKMNCYLIQGYLFSRPVDVASFEKAFLSRVRNID